MKAAATLLTLLIGGFLALTVRADVPDKYQTIVDRNSFGLNPPPPPQAETNTVVPPANVKLTGFATINGQKKAYFTIPGKNPNDQQYVGLLEGDREGILEVIAISDQEGEVRIRNSGVEMVLSLKNNAFKPATIAPGVAVAPNNPGGIPPTPGSVAGAPSPVYNPSAPSPVVSDYARMTQPNPNPNPNQNNNQPQPGVQPNGTTPEGMRSIPTRTLRLNPQSPQSSVEPQSFSPVVYGGSSSSSRSSFSTSTAVASYNPVPNTSLSFGRSGGGSTTVQHEYNQQIDPATQALIMQANQQVAEQNGGKVQVEVEVPQNPIVAGPPQKVIKEYDVPPLPH